MLPFQMLRIGAFNHLKSASPSLMNTSLHRSFSQSLSALQIFLQVGNTPNPDSLKFFPGVDVTGSTQTYEIRTPKQAEASPLAKALFKISGVTGVFLGNDFITVSKQSESSWADIKPSVFTEILDHFANGGPLINEKRLQEADETGDAPHHLTEEEESEVVLMIKETLDTRIRPSVQEDGGDIQFIRFEDGVVYLKLQGSCSGCPSSSITLHSGIERTLKYWISEVVSVVNVKDDELENLNDKEFQKLEDQLSTEK